jgi:vacuolar-type H+-ATPase subunit H
MMIMADELLSDILAAERAIRLEIDELEEEVAEELESLQQELDAELAAAARALQAELSVALSQAETMAQQEAAALLDDVRAFARRLENLDTAKLDAVVRRQLVQILPAGAA